MKCFVPEISWHNREPVYSIDIQPKTNQSEEFYRLASGGADSHVVIWHVVLKPDDESGQYAKFDCAADLQRHQKTVNCVRFSPNGSILASADDDGYIILWKMRVDQDPPELPGLDSEKDKESWICFKVLRGHLQDIYDLAWSPDSLFLISGSIDNTAILWDIEKARNLGILGDHKGFVQGVSWDPKGKYIATLSTDRCLRVFDSVKRKQVARSSKQKLPSTLAKEKEKDKENKEAKDEKDKGTKLYHNDTLKTFFRRLHFSPRGELLFAPCGIIEDEGGDIDVTYIYNRSSFLRPVVHLPSPGQYTVAVRACPNLYQLRGSKPGLFALPYRIVFAVATRSTLILYDTEQLQPFGFVSNIHYTGLTDIAWSSDARLIIVSSSEGYCSVITFDENEIGTLYSPSTASEAAKTETTLGAKSTETPVSLESSLAEPLDESINSQDTMAGPVNESISSQETVETMEHMESANTETLPGKSSLTQISSDISQESSKNIDEPMDVDDKVVDIQHEESEDKITTADQKTPDKKREGSEEEVLDTTPKKSRVTPEKNSETVTPIKSERITDHVFKTPDKSSIYRGISAGSQDSLISELSICVVGEEEELISKEEQARRLMSPYLGSPRRESPIRKTPKKEETSPKTPKSGRRVALITLSSPKTKRKL